MVGGGIGLGVAFLYSLTFGALCLGVVGSFLLYAPGFGLVGTVVGAIRIEPELVGAASGLALYSAWVALTGPNDGWIYLIMVITGVSGFFCGALIGFLFRIGYAKLCSIDSTNLHGDETNNSLDE